MFTGAEVEGDSGFVNLMRMKCDYFRSIRPKLMESIDKRAEKDTNFREELSEDKEFTLPNTPEKRNPHLSKDIGWDGGGAFKYYGMEQYEETLNKSHYQDGKQLELDSAKSPFEQYVFFGDDKLAHAVKPGKNKLEIKLNNLYPDIDIAESLSNTLGKPIRHRTANDVTFADGTIEKTNPAKMTEEEKRHFIGLIKPYLWWGEC